MPFGALFYIVKRDLSTSARQYGNLTKTRGKETQRATEESQERGVNAA
jgi:hypothetical protein